MQLVAACLPIFVAAMAISAFLNGLLMSTGGYFIKADNLPRFWYYSVHWYVLVSDSQVGNDDIGAFSDGVPCRMNLRRMDYQTYAFVLLTNSDLRDLISQCESSGCLYPSSVGGGEVSGQDILNSLDIGGIDYGTYGM